MVDENKENLNRQRTVEDQTDQTVLSSNMTETKLTAILCKHFHHDATKTSLHAALCYYPGVEPRIYVCHVCLVSGSIES